MANPFLNRPEDLNEHTWYLVRADQIGDLDVGSWRQVGQPRQMPFLDWAIVCRKIIRVFHNRGNEETEWMMLQYEIPTPNGTVSLCRIGKGPMNHDAQVGGVLYPFQAAAADAAAENLPESEMFLGGDYMELLDLDVPLSPRSN
ncbi:hypothetical protein MLD38_000745 [Melastoma candidum]|uniref:Uncharacterized protein n=1 Tax=Melastoma candidum TaxID=119954 RepID=A0ACB9SCN8_9MYRT|nr:hypothetical protein MLD38_000745 [Melastoma candidum]